MQFHQEKPQVWSSSVLSWLNISIFFFTFFCFAELPLDHAELMLWRWCLTIQETFLFSGKKHVRHMFVDQTWIKIRLIKLLPSKQKSFKDFVHVHPYFG